MKLIKENISAYRIPEIKKKFNARWEVLADEMTTCFGRNCYRIFRRKEDWKIRNAYQICRIKGIRSLSYLMGILKNL